MPARSGPRGGRPKERRATDKESAEYWRSLKGGDFVGISDAQAFEASLAKGGGSGGSLDYEVGEVRRFSLRGTRSGAALGTYAFIELLQEGSGPLYLVLVDLPERFELRLYFIPAGLEPGTRDDFIDRGDAWLFLPPPDPEDFHSSELEYAPYPDVPEIEEEGRSRKLVFSRVGPGSLYGESLDTGASVIITEYASDPGGMAPPANPLLIALEEGWMRSDGTQPEEGGYLTVMLGKVMQTSDLEYWPA
jgi:hypothetical protein